MVLELDARRAMSDNNQAEASQPEAGASTTAKSDKTDASQPDTNSKDAASTNRTETAAAAAKDQSRQGMAGGEQQSSLDPWIVCSWPDVAALQSIWDKRPKDWRQAVTAGNVQHQSWNYSDMEIIACTYAW